MKTTIKNSLIKYVILIITIGVPLPSLLPLSAAAQGDGGVVVPAAFTQQQKLAAAGGAANDAYGWAVAIDGNTAVIGAPLTDVGGKADQGVAYIYVQSNGVWVEQAKLIASDGAANARFGCAVAIDGDTVVIGASHPSIAGTVYVFVRDGSIWTEQAKLIGKDSKTDDQFGFAVAISENSIVVGALAHDVAGTPNNNKGAAYVFVRSGVTWTEQTKLLASEPQEHDFFGAAVAIDGDTILVGAPHNPSTLSSGSAYFFTRAGELWSEQGHLKASDESAGNAFGEAVSLSGDVAVIGADGATAANTKWAGAVYVSRRSNNQWAEEVKLTANAADLIPNATFGWAVALKGDRLAVGTIGASVGNNLKQGFAYLFKYDGNLWQPEPRITASDGAAQDFFGVSLALGDGTLLIGASQRTTCCGTTSQPGKAYFFSTANVIDNGEPQIQSVAVDGKQLIVTGKNFDAPSLIFLNGEKQKKTVNDELKPTTTVIGIKAGKLIAPGQTVSVQVKNTKTGKFSNEFIFTRALE
jgi:hypothetical protein